jgi:hypothetical protein
MQAAKRRKPARQAENSAAMKQINRQANPTLRGQVRVQNLAFAPSGFKKYPYVSPERGTNIVKACLCHNQTKRMTPIAARKGTSILVRRKTARLSQLAEMPRATHHPPKTIGNVSHPYFSPMTIVTQVAQSPMINGTMVERAICPVVGFSGVIVLADSAQILSRPTFAVDAGLVQVSKVQQQE